MKENYEKILNSGTDVLVISFDTTESIKKHQNMLDLPFLIASDLDRIAYKNYGLTRGSSWNIWHPKTILKYLKLGLNGMQPRKAKKGDDLNQLGGNFIIDSESIIIFAHRSQRPDDRPHIDLILESIK